MNTDESLISQMRFLKPTGTFETPEFNYKEPEIFSGTFDVIIYPDDMPKKLTVLGLRNKISGIDNVISVKFRGVNDKIIATIEYSAEKEDYNDDYFTFENKIENEIDEIYA